MSQIFQLHSDNPQVHLLRKISQIIAQGGIGIIPTDSAYAFVCRLGDKHAIERIRKIRQLSDKHHLTLLCRDLSELSSYAKVSNATFRLLKALTPGAFTFILNATKQVPRMTQHPNRKTIGLRVPDNIITCAILEACENALVSTTLQLPDFEFPLVEPESMQDILGKRVDFIVNGGFCGIEPTTVIDCSNENEKPLILRQGKGVVTVPW